MGGVGARTSMGGSGSPRPQAPSAMAMVATAHSGTIRRQAGGCDGGMNCLLIGVATLFIIVLPKQAPVQVLGVSPNIRWPDATAKPTAGNAAKVRRRRQKGVGGMPSTLLGHKKVDPRPLR